MAKCEICGKTPSFGHSVSHSNVRTKRQWKPNIQKVSVYQDGKPSKDESLHPLPANAEQSIVPLLFHGPALV